MAWDANRSISTAPSAKFEATMTPTRITRARPLRRGSAHPSLRSPCCPPDTAVNGPEHRRRHGLREYPLGRPHRVIRSHGGDPREQLVHRQDLALADLGLAEPGHPPAGILLGEYERAPHVAFRSVELVARETRRANADVRLLGVAAFDQRATRRLGRAARLAHLPRHRPLAPNRSRLHARGEELEHLLVLEVADGDHHDVPGYVVLAPVTADLIAGGRADALLGAEDRPAQRMVRPQRLREQVVDQVVRSVLVDVDLLQDHLLLGLEIALTDHRALQHVGQVLDGHRKVAIEYAGVEACVLLRGERVQFAADRVERLGDVAGAARLRPLEQEVLEEVTRAADRRRLVT